MRCYGIVYRLTFPNGKVYIGLTARELGMRLGEHNKDSRRKNPKSVVGRAIKKYGWRDVIVEVLFCAFDVESLNWSETHLISEHKSQDMEVGYNRDKGGRGRSDFVCSEATKQKISLANRGKHQWCEDSRQRIAAARRRRPMIQLSETGEIITEYATVKEAWFATDISISHICQVARGERKSAGGFIWRYKDDERDLVIPDRIGRDRPVIQKSCTKEIITIHTSAMVASRVTGICRTNINNVCRGKAKSAGGFLWCYPT